MKHIVLPTDFSENSKNAMRYAVHLFQNTACTFYVLHVNVKGSEYREKPIYTLGTNILVEKESESIAQQLNGLKQYLQVIFSENDNHRFTTVHKEGSFLNTIRNYIRQKNIELIVMGTQGASELKEFLTGTRSGDVITKVGCDVLVIPEGKAYSGFREVVLPVDFELSYTQDTLKKISDILSSEMTKIRLLYITKSAIPLYQNIEMRQKELVQHLSELGPNPVSFHRVIAKKIEDGIQAFAEKLDADLIIMISKNYGLLQKLFLDTTVEEVSFDTKIPLLSVQDFSSR